MNNQIFPKIRTLETIQCRHNIVPSKESTVFRFIMYHCSFEHVIVSSSNFDSLRCCVNKSQRMLRTFGVRCRAQKYPCMQEDRKTRHRSMIYMTMSTLEGPKYFISIETGHTNTSSNKEFVSCSSGSTDLKIKEIN